MNINLQISDSAYQRLVSSGSRIQGTIGLINPTELTLRIGLDEVDVIPSQVIEDESKEASAFIEGMYDDAFGY